MINVPESFKATFRGRQLKALLLEKPLIQYSTQNETLLKKERSFDQCYIWDHDQLPSSEHPILKTMDYVSMMEQVNKVLFYSL
jgi:hypothetical protein